MTQIGPHRLAEIGFQRAIPMPVLRPFIKWFWVIESNGKLLEKRHEFMHPDGSLSLFFNWGDELALENGRSLQTVTLGKVEPYSRMMTLSGNVQAFGILFKPSGAFPFFGIPMHEMTTVGALHKHQLTNLHEQLAELPNFMSKVSFVENWLISLLNDNHIPSNWVPASINLINLSLGKQAIHEVANQVYLSERQLERLYKKEVGISPKKYARLIRLRHARQALKQATTSSLSDIAHQAGYYDQAHFNHEFKNSIGITPGAYLARQEARRQ